jgi:hypothetical protein
MDIGSRAVSMSVLHGNVRDPVPWTRPGSAGFPPLQRFFKDALFGQRDRPIQWGVSTPSPVFRGGGARCILRV